MVSSETIISESAEIENRKLVEDLLRTLYTLSGLSPPTSIFWRSNPLSAALDATILLEQNEVSVKNEVWDGALDQALAQIEQESVSDEELFESWDLIDATWMPLFSSLERNRKILFQQLSQPLKNRGRAFDSRAACCGQFAGDRVGYRLTHSFLADAPCTRLELLARIVLRTALWWPFRNSVILSQRPIWTSGSGFFLQSTPPGGPIMEFEGGWSLFGDPLFGDEENVVSMQRFQNLG